MSKQVQDAYIVSATRTPIGKSHRGYFRNYRPDDLLATTLKAALAASARARSEGDRGRHLRLRDSRIAAGPERGAHRRRARRPAQQRRRHHGQPLLRLGPVGGADGGRPHPRRRGRSDDRRRRREHEHGADDGQLALAVALDLRARRRRRHRLRHGPDGREGGPAVEGEPRGAGRLRARVAPPGAGRPAGRRVRRRDHADRSHRPRARPRHRRVGGQEPHRQPRRRRAPRHHARRPGQAAHRVRGPRLGHGRQQLADLGRRRRADPGQREGLQAVRPRSRWRAS